jgi:AcrR family transcriptional regulator
MKRTNGDHRTRVTRMLLRSAFMTLLKEKPIENITIRQLCDLAGLNRGTFYVYYRDIYDMRSKIEQEMFDEFKQAMAPLLDTASQTSSKDYILGIFNCLRSNADLCTVTLGKYGDKAFMLRLMDLGRDYYFQSYRKHFEHVGAQDLEYYYAFASAGCIGMLHKWLDDGMPLADTQIARLTEGFLFHGAAYFAAIKDARK